MENEMTATIHQLFGINIETEELNPTRREFEDVRKDFFNRLDQSIDAILDGREEDAPMCGFKNINGDIEKRKLVFRLGMGKGNYYFANGFHTQGLYLSLSEKNKKELFPAMKENKEMREYLEKCVKAKFDAQVQNGLNGIEKRQANAEAVASTASFKPEAVAAE